MVGAQTHLGPREQGVCPTQGLFSERSPKAREMGAENVNAGGEGEGERGGTPVGRTIESTLGLNLVSVFHPQLFGSLSRPHRKSHQAEGRD